MGCLRLRLRFDRATGRYEDDGDPTLEQHVGRAAALARTIARYRAMNVPGLGGFVRSAIAAMITMRRESIAECCRLLAIDERELMRRFNTLKL